MAYAYSDDPTPTVGLTFIREQLGRRNYGIRRLCSYVQLLVDQRGFPPPLPALAQSRRKGAGQPIADQLTDSVTKDSRWFRQPVEAWLEDFLPPANAAAVDARTRRAAAADMDAAARGLQLVQGGRS